MLLPVVFAIIFVVPVILVAFDAVPYSGLSLFVPFIMVHKPLKSTFGVRACKPLYLNTNKSYSSEAENGREAENGKLVPIKTYGDLQLKETKTQITKDFPCHTGLYGFKCLITNDMYVGSAQKIHRRYYEHINGFHSNIVLQHAFKKYGLENFSFIIYVAVSADLNVLTKSALEELESKLISSFNSETLYNLTKNTATNKGLRHTEEAKLRMKELRNERGHPNQKPVYVYDENLNLIKCLETQAELRKTIGID
ncbi:MAG: GIY-YIG nuclease family protein [Rickettsia endosymbiont of Ixodes persulcatus]|nr:GIY-YIG nuclease family protein [Rickettsia endosymbiont of Ixodes persulcatus]